MTEIVATSAAPEQPRRRGGGRPFVPGQSGNPRGRKPGTRNSATVMVERLMEDDVKAVVEATIAAALKGDTSAIKLILDRVSPVRRGRPIALQLPAIDTAADLVAAAAAITNAMAAGTITPEEAVVAGGALELQRRVIETVDLARRLDALEQNNGDS